MFYTTSLSRELSKLECKPCYNIHNYGKIFVVKDFVVVKHILDSRLGVSISDCSLIRIFPKQS